MDTRFDLIIIGAGPAGMTASIYAARAGLKVAMLEYSAPGGKLIKTNEIANWPGEKMISGVDLAMQFFDHTSETGAEYLYGNVVNIEDGDYKRIVCEDGSVYKAKAVIIATGTVEKTLGLELEDKLTGFGVSYCAVCDGAFFKGKDVMVVGAGNSAIEESLYLAQFVNKVTIVMRRDVFRADQNVVDLVKANEKIEIIQHYVPVELKEENNKLSGVVIKSVNTNEEKLIEVSGIFPYIGANPATSFAGSLDILDSEGYIVVDKDQMTSVPGVFGAGDVCQKNLRQIVTATSDGAVAAQAAFYYIKQK